jgi:uncharacterized protein YegP (UPF0339 family)
VTGRGRRPVVYDTDADRRVTVYRDEGSLWRWHAKARNGLIVGDSGQGYSRKDSALRAARREHPPKPRAT